MKLEWVYTQEKTDWEELSRLYRLAPLGDKRPADLETAFSNSRYKCFVFDAGQLVGAGRALADGIDCAYLGDVAVLPSHQGLGIGKAIVAELVTLAKGHRKILLYTAPDNEAFYRNLGFKRMTMAMAIFENETLAQELALIHQT